MKKSYLKLILIELITIILLLVNLFKFDINNYYYLIVYFIVIFGILYLSLGYEKDKYRFKKDIILNLLIYSIGYLLLTYIAGVFTGFVRNGSWLSITSDLLPYFLLIIVSEFVRYEIIKKGEFNKIIYGLVVIIFTLVDITLFINSYDLSTSDGLIKLICSIVLPSLSKNIMLTYLTFKVGYKPSMIYRIIFELKSFILPIFPDFGTYLNAILDLLYPVFILLRVRFLFSTFKDEEVIARGIKNNKLTVLIATIVFLIFIPIVSLTSGLFKYYAVTIGSGSMTPHINKGDIVIVEKLDDQEKEKLNVG